MEDFLQILLYLYSQKRDVTDIAPERDDLLLDDLVAAGFVRDQAHSALASLREMKIQSETYQDIKPSSAQAFRIFTAAEQQKITQDTRGFILFMEQAGVLDISMRELLIDLVMGLEQPIVEMTELRCLLDVVLLPNLSPDSPVVAACHLLFANNGTLH
jgi:Smg protein